MGFLLRLTHNLMVVEVLTKAHLMCQKSQWKSLKAAFEALKALITQMGDKTRFG